MKNQHIKYGSLALLLAATLSACSSLPPYRAPVASDKTATVDVSRINANSICVNGELYGIGSVPNKQLIVPTDSRVAIYAWVYISEYYSNYSCMPGISFRPKPGANYLMNLELQSDVCVIEVYRKDDAMPLGLDVERTSGPARLCN